MSAGRAAAGRKEKCKVRESVGDVMSAACTLRCPLDFVHVLARWVRVPSAPKAAREGLSMSLTHSFARRAGVRPAGMQSASYDLLQVVRESASQLRTSLLDSVLNAHLSEETIVCLLLRLFVCVRAPVCAGARAFICVCIFFACASFRCTSFCSGGHTLCTVKYTQKPTCVYYHV